MQGFEWSADRMQILPMPYTRDVAMACMFGFLCIGCTLAPLRIMTEPSMCGSDAALCQITLTTCYYYEAASQ